MDAVTDRFVEDSTQLKASMQLHGPTLLRYGLVLVIVWFAFMKFTDFGAQGIRPMVARSPLLGWMYHYLSARAFAAGLGSVELVIAVLIALRPWSAKACAAGSAGAVMMFLTTLSFLFSTPGWEPSLGGFPAISPAGQFLIKDVVLFAVALWSLEEAWTAVRRSGQASGYAQ